MTITTFKVGQRIKKTMGVRQSGEVIPYVYKANYTDGSYREPRSSEDVTYVKWDDGSKGWAFDCHLTAE